MAKKRKRGQGWGSGIRNLRNAAERASYLSEWAADQTPQLERILDKVELLVDNGLAQLERMHKALHIAAGSAPDVLIPPNKPTKKTTKKKARKKAA